MFTWNKLLTVNVNNMMNYKETISTTTVRVYGTSARCANQSVLEIILLQ